MHDSLLYKSMRDVENNCGQIFFTTEQIGKYMEVEKNWEGQKICEIEN